MKRQVPMWTSRLGEGEEVRLFGSAWFYAWLVPFTLAGVLLLRDVVSAAMRLLMRGTGLGIGSPDFLAAAFLPLWLAVLAYLWGSLLLSKIRLTPTGFDFANWQGRHRCVEYSDVAGLEWNPPRPKEIVVYVVPPGGGLEPPVCIRFDSTRTGLANAIRDLLVQRCGLLESDSPEAPEEASFLWRHGEEDRITRTPWWHL